jgi:phosphatidylglycerophosphatase A
MFRTLNSLSKAIATALGAGYSPIAPGTCGTAVTVPLAFALAALPVWQYSLVLALVIAAGIWAADRADQAWGTHDAQRIVIDEVAGYLITMTFVARDRLVPLLVGFVVFRVFDIVKPPPIRWLDQHVEGGFGVMIDDVAAGVLGMVTMIALDRFGALAWMMGL